MENVEEAGRRRSTTVLLVAGFTLLWLLDVLTSRHVWVWPPLLGGPLVALLVLAPGRWWPGRVAESTVIRWRVLAAFAVSAGVTLLLLRSGEAGSWGLMESAALLTLLVGAARSAPMPEAVGLCLLVGAAVIAAPLRISGGGDEITFAFLLTLAAGGAVGLGGYLRGLDNRRAQAVHRVRERERLELARDLHDFVAHHVTGIVVQAQAARTIRETAPERLDPLLEGIERAGAETLESMRRLVRVLREEDGGTVRPENLLTELGVLVSVFGEREGGGTATLEVAADARSVRLAPEVETSVHRLVQEALTNVARHAPGAPGVRVTMGLSEGHREGAWLVVRVVNGPADRTPPPGGRGGFGLVGLRERVEAVGGGLDVGPTESGGWRVVGRFPVLESGGSVG
ncbi:sensor histidine kinase [Streptomyces alkaliterrae]|uniref:histidine kinase n=1 Tax=Streptomyces alkaliterrae TaxID=2213162 RepID=A0A5P0YLN9_9ACTN|nr:histidine kinase [Streptomyces alkaliterrae]MBB1251820.1 two-component sensor histidine kinase [Streptomyces alkaliterrae]MBB1259532.1 two-component sensor histidine kinase [Streptomyces alkaliterrae]MQS00342.1 two-component sensor histidine kinase [Streptomyces alkaliterrae]